MKLETTFYRTVKKQQQQQQTNKNKKQTNKKHRNRNSFSNGSEESLYEGCNNEFHTGVKKFRVTQSHPKYEIIECHGINSMTLIGVDDMYNVSPLN